MNIFPSAVSRNPDLLQSLFDSSDSTRMPCPICREFGKDSGGDHLQIGQHKVTCHANPDHGKVLWRSLKSGVATESAPKTRRPATGRGREDLAQAFYEAPAASGPFKFQKAKRLPPWFAGSRLVNRGQRTVLVFPLQSAAERTAGTVKCVVVVEANGDRKTYGAMKDEDAHPRYGFHGDGTKAPVLVEGFSTGASVHRTTGLDVVVAAGAGRIPALAKAVKAAAVYADNDQAGITAALKTGLPVHVPGKAGHDWLDAELEDADKAAQEIKEPVPADVLARSIEGDVPPIVAKVEAFAKAFDGEDAPEDVTDGLLADIRGNLRRTARETLIFSFAAGRLLQHVKSRLGHGLLGVWLEDRGIDRNWASRAMKVAAKPWAQVAVFNSVSEALAADRKPRDKQGATPSKAQLEAEARDATIFALEQQVEELKAKLHAENPPAEDIIAERDQLKRENKALRNRNTQHVREGRRKDEQNARLQRANDALRDQMRTVVNEGNSANLPGEDKAKFVNVDEFAECIPVSSPMPADPKDLLPWVDTQPELKRIVDEFFAEFQREFEDYKAGSQYPDD